MKKNQLRMKCMYLLVEEKCCECLQGQNNLVVVVEL